MAAPWSSPPPPPSAPPRRGTGLVIGVVVGALVLVLAGAGIAGYLILGGSGAPDDTPSGWPSAGFTVSGDEGTRDAVGRLLVVLAHTDARYAVRPHGVRLAVRQGHEADLRRVRAMAPLRTDLALRPVLGTPAPGSCPSGAGSASATADELCGLDGIRYRLGPAGVTGTDVRDANWDNSGGAGWHVTLEFTSRGEAAVTRLTRQTVQRQLAIVIAGAVVSAPVVQSVITGPVQIVGDNTSTGAEGLARACRLARRPVAVAAGNPG